MKNKRKQIKPKLTRLQLYFLLNSEKFGNTQIEDKLRKRGYLFGMQPTITGYKELRLANLITKSEYERALEHNKWARSIGFL